MNQPLLPLSDARLQELQKRGCTIIGIELVEKIKKGQFNTSRVVISTRVPAAHICEVW